MSPFYETKNMTPELKQYYDWAKPQSFPPPLFVVFEGGRKPGDMRSCCCVASNGRLTIKDMPAPNAQMPYYFL